MLSRTVWGSEFQTAGAEWRKARPAKSVLMEGWASRSVGRPKIPRTVSGLQMMTEVGWCTGLCRWPPPTCKWFSAWPAASAACYGIWTCHNGLRIYIMVIISGSRDFCRSQNFEPSFGVSLLLWNCQFLQHFIELLLIVPEWWLD